MKQFAELYTSLDETTKTTRKVQALRKYFANAAPGDAAWAVYFLIGRKPRQVVRSSKLREWAALEAGIPDWLFRESYDAVGDVAETIALLLPTPEHSSELPLAYWIEHRLLPLRELEEDEQRVALVAAWRELDQPQRFIWNKLISGAFRVGVSQQLVTRALALVAGLDAPTISHRLMGDWEPSALFFTGLVAGDAAGPLLSQPYPFFLAHAIDQPVENLGERSEWQAEWKWDGIRCQMIRRSGQTFLWSRGEELVTDRYPELKALGDVLPEGTVLDGEILPFIDDRVLPFAMLQRRIGRKAVTRAILAQVPVVLMAYDLLEIDGDDVRVWPLEKRRHALSLLIESVHAGSAAVAPQLRLSPIVEAPTWAELTRTWRMSRAALAEGLMLKRRDSAYGVGRPRGAWWKWKTAPFTIDAVLIAAQRGSGKRASLYTDYTFGIWNNGELVPIAKAYSGLTDEEIRDVDAFVRRNMLEKFGPVRTVKPELVFELAFEGLNRSSRHKSGIAVRFPRILRRRPDKPANEADTLDSVAALLASEAVGERRKDDARTDANNALLQGVQTMSSSKKKREGAQQRLKRGLQARERIVRVDARVTELDIHREIRYITQLAQAEDSRTVTVGNLVLFSTRTGDAWLLDPEDGLAVCLCRGGEPQPFRIIDTPDTFGVEWSASFAIEGEQFIVHEQSGRVVAIHGYPTVEISAACRR